MSALLDSLAAGFAGSDARRAELDAALATGLPAPRSEAFKYTSLKALDRRQFVPAPAAVTLADTALLAGILITLSFIGATVIYNTGFYWAASQVVLCPLLIIRAAVEWYQGDRKRFGFKYRETI